MDRKATHDVPSLESIHHHEKSEEGKVVYLGFLQHRTELEFWNAIDRLADYAQRHELLLHRITNRQWKLFALITFSISLQLLHMSAQAKVWLTTMMHYMTQ
jgi:hypothetical protein